MCGFSLLRLRQRLWPCLLFLFPALACARIPDWVWSVAKAEVPAKFADEDAVVLLDWFAREYERDGDHEDRFRWVVKIQSLEGRDEAEFEVSYNKETDRIRDFDIYILHPDRDPVELDKGDCYKHEAGSGDSLVSETWKMGYSAIAEARPGTIIAFEVRRTASSIFADGGITFNGEYPCLLSENEYILPEGWTLEPTERENDSVTIESERTGNRWIWRARNVPGHGELLPGEIYDAVASGVRIRLVPDPAHPPRKPLISWQTWEDLAQYTAKIYARKGSTDGPIRAKALELTADKSDPLEKVRAIARFTQEVNYISISQNLTQGGGYEPHAATETLETFWGDCKDKANLACSLLQAVGIEAYPLLVYSGYDQRTDADWPNPSQFNHAIVAVRSEPDGHWLTTIEHPVLGKLLIFDPTASSTIAGNLPNHLQYRYALLGATTEDPLIWLPLGSSEDRGANREVTATLSVNGDLTAKIVTDYRGLETDDWRELVRSTRASDLRDGLQVGLQSFLRRVTLKNHSIEDVPEENRLTITLDFDSPGYARSLRQRLLIFQPILVDRQSWIPNADDERTNDLRTSPKHFLDHYHYVLPEGFVLDEAPPDVEVERPYALYRITTSYADGILEVTRELVWKPATIPAEDYEDYRSFHRAIRDGDNATIVLAKE